MVEASHFFEDFFHPRGLAVGDDDLHAGVALHYGEADEGGGDEHVVVEPVGEDWGHGMAQGCAGGAGREGDGAFLIAATG